MISNENYNDLLVEFKTEVQQYSPEQIVGMLPRMFPVDRSMRAGDVTIYTALYTMPRGELRTELLSTLRQGCRNASAVCTIVSEPVCL
jgi:IS30 family transposase